MTAPDGPVGVAVVGCGTISNEYLRNLTSFPDLRVLFCADLDLERAKEQAAKYGVPEAGTAAQALRRPGSPRPRWPRARASGLRSRSPSTPAPDSACSPRRTGRDCASVAHPTPCSALGCRPHGG
jgi:hypothetical protein